MAWSTSVDNHIYACDTSNSNIVSNFQGPQLKFSSLGTTIISVIFSNDFEGYWSHVKGIPQTSLLVSAYHSADNSANFGIFDLSKGSRVVFSFEDVVGSNYLHNLQ